MNRIRLSSIFWLTVITTSGWAIDGNSIIMKGDSSYWICKAYDEQNNQWISKSPYEQVALNKAFETCKKQSETPESCKTAKEYCEAFVQGVSLRAMFQCTALDMLARTWTGDTYSRPEEAALGAIAYCEEQSSLPDTCYVNLLTCKNTNLAHR